MKSSIQKIQQTYEIGTLQNTFTMSKTAICSQEEAKVVAKDIWDRYQQGGSLRDDSLRQMMTQIYFFMNQDFNPSNQDVDGYQKVIDLQGQGVISIEDLEQHCIQFLCGGVPQEVEKPKMSAKKQAWIDQKKKVAERIFKKYDNGTGYITKNEVSGLITDTYAQVGINKIPNQNEIDQWMKNNDLSGDGKVEMSEYTESITNALMELASELEIE